MHACIRNNAWIMKELGTLALLVEGGVVFLKYEP